MLHRYTLYACTHTNIHKYVYVCVCVCVCVSVCTCMCVCVFVNLLANDEITQISDAHPRGIHVANAQNLVANANAVGAVSGAARNHLFHRDDG